MKQFILFLFCISFLTSSAQGIDFFKGTFAEAQAEAKKEGKIIFMDAYAEWCGPCKRMARDVFPTKEAGDFFNENFINVKMDMEKGEGRTLAQKYGVRSYPTLLFLDYTGGVVYETKGARRDAASLIKLGEQALKPSKNSLTLLQKKWTEGNRQADFLQEYITTLSAFNEDNTEAFTAYLNTLTEKEKQDESVLKFIFRNTTTAISPGMQFIKANQKTLRPNMGIENFDKKISSIATESVKLAVKTENVSLLKDAQKTLSSFKPKGFKKQQSFINVKYYGAVKNWNAYDKAVSKYLKKYENGNDVAYNKVAWNYYMNIADESKLAKAEKWMQAAIKTNNTYQNNLTQAYLLYKLERFSEAQDAVEYALILSKTGTNQTKNAEILKGKIEEALANGKKKEVVIDYSLE